MDYITWVKIIAMAVRLMNEPAVEKEFRIHATWIPFERIHLLEGNIRKSLLSISIIRKGSQETVKSYVFLPWEDLYEKPLDPDDFPAPALLNKLHTVTPVYLIYEIGSSCEISEQEENALRSFETRFNRLTGYEFCNELIRKDGSMTLPGQLQVMDLQEFRYYVVIQAAVPGSRSVIPDKITGAFPGRMIQLVMTPDAGTSTTRWISGMEPDFGPWFDKIKGELAVILPDTVKKFEKSLEKQNKPEAAAEHEKTDHSKPEEEETEPAESKNVGTGPDRGKDLKEPPVVTGEEPDYYYEETFPDYTPKTTPDDVLDYMPSLAAAVINLPEAVPENLPEYLDMFRRYKEAAAARPGRWVEGNMLLGAGSVEYEPSEQELMLAEIGGRIRRIISDHERSKIRSILQQHSVSTEEISYREYRFIHYDVMGSGRFFYVGDMEDVVVKIF